VTEPRRGRLLAVHQCDPGSRLYEVEPGPHGTVLIVDGDGQEFGPLPLGSLLAHSPYWNFVPSGADLNIAERPEPANSLWSGRIALRRRST